MEAGRRSKGSKVSWWICRDRLKWAGGKVVSVKVKSTIGGNLRLRTATPLTLADGTALNPATGNNSNALMQPYNMPAPIVKDMSKIPATNLEETQLYDIPTVAGEEITLVANGVTGIKLRMPMRGLLLLPQQSTTSVASEWLTLTMAS